MSDKGLEPVHNLAIRQEIGERLQILLPLQAELPPQLRELVRRFEADDCPRDKARRLPEKIEAALEDDALQAA
jgi:hypothetical protein